MKKYEVIIIGAGTAGLTARRQVAKKTDSYLVIDDGPLGTTCARVGCMPSKVLIQAANDFYRRHSLKEMGIEKGEELTLNPYKVMEHVRSLRDRFVRSVRKGMEDWEKSHLLRGRAYFVDKHTVEVSGQKYKASKFVLAVGSRPLFLPDWEPFKDHIITTDQVFEMERLPESLLVLGLGVIGVELGQAFSRLGVQVYGATLNPSLGGLTDPDLQKYVAKKLAEDFPIFFDGAKLLKINEEEKVDFEAGGKKISVDKVLVSIGRRHNADLLSLDKASVSLDKRGLPDFDTNTLKLKEADHITFPGDVNSFRPILHEAADEGFIAGYNSVNKEQCYKRRMSLGITFTDPNIATVGARFTNLEKGSFVTGEVSFEGQGRSIVKLKEVGLLHIYVSKNSHKILGAEIFAPDGEHLAHLLAWAISMKLTVFEALKMPFYHPVVEEGLRTALRDAASKLEHSSNELYRCGDTPIR